MNVWEPDWYLAERLIEFWLQLAEAGVAMEIEAERRERDGSFAREAAQVRAWVSLRARWVSLRARWVTLRARWVTFRCRRRHGSRTRRRARASARDEATDSHTTSDGDRATESASTSDRVNVLKSVRRYARYAALDSR